MYKVTTYLNDDNMPYLVREEVNYNVNKMTQYTDTDKVYELCKAIHMTERATEMVLLLIFDAGQHLLGISEISTGSIDRSIISTREIAQTMLLSGGVNAIVIHNHPSGDVEPSETDIASTRKLIEGLRLLNLTLLDHMVVGRWNYTSMREKGVM
jgi:DNA repair protein RadC